MQASNFGGAFDQLFIWISLRNFHRRCVSILSIPWCKKVKNDQKLKPRGSCLKLHWSTCLHHGFRTAPKEPFSGSEFTLALHLDILDADRCRFSAKLSTIILFDYHFKTKKETVKIVLKNKKKSESPRRLGWKIDEYIIDHSFEDACAKVANVKSVNTRWLNVRRGYIPKLIPTRTHGVYQFIVPVRWGDA